MGSLSSAVLLPAAPVSLSAFAWSVNEPSTKKQKYIYICT